MIAYGTYITRFRLQAVKIRCQHPASLRWVFVPLLFLLLATDLHAQLISDTLNIRFRRDSVIIDMDFDGNRQRWEAFEREYRERYSDTCRRAVFVSTSTLEHPPKGLPRATAGWAVIVATPSGIW